MEKYKYSAVRRSREQGIRRRNCPSVGAAHLALLERGIPDHRGSTRRRTSCSSRSPRRWCLARTSCTSRGSWPSSCERAFPSWRPSKIIADETPDKLLQRGLYDMIERLQAGDTFASAAAAHPEAFPNYYVGILSSAELTGNLDVVLDQLADYLDRDIEARGQDHVGPGLSRRRCRAWRSSSSSSWPPS